METTWCKSSWENVAICCRLKKPISRPFERYNGETKERKSSNPYGYYVYTICVYTKLMKYTKGEFKFLSQYYKLYNPIKWNERKTLFYIYLHFTSNSHLSSRTPILSSGFVALQ